jgi:acetyl-CoA acetyltransferase
MSTFADDALITGVGISEVGRRLGVDPWLLTAQAALAAIEDAGLDPGDVDGISTYPGGWWHNPSLAGAGAPDVAALLGVRPTWYRGGGEGASQLCGVFDAAMAVSCGAARHVLCFRTVWESTYQEGRGRAAVVVDGAPPGGGRRPMTATQERSFPYGAGYPCEGALLAQRYFYEHGVGREALGSLAVAQRSHAAGNPLAVFREPLTMEDYLGARMISTPLCLFDCDVPVDGSIAFVVSARGAKPSGSSSMPVSIHAIGQSMGMGAAASQMQASSRISPEAVQVAQLYDGWSIIALMWLDALGLCEPGEAGRFVDGGGAIALDGPLPLNTGGGQLSAGRLHGYLQLYEACVQIRGQGGDRQVHPQPEVAAVAVGVSDFSGCMLVTAAH